jgi:hypothetical protein
MKMRGIRRLARWTVIRGRLARWTVIRGRLARWTVICGLAAPNPVEWGIP